MTELALRVYLCDALVFDNTSLAMDAAVAFLTVVAKTPADVDQTGHTEAFVLEAWTTSSLVQTRFADAGFQIQQALDIATVTSRTGMSVHVEGLDASLVFAAPVAVERVEAPSPGTYRFFHTAPEVAWLRQDLGFEETLPFLLEPGTLEYQGGMMAKIMGEPEGQLAWLASDNLVSGESRFERQ